MNRRTAMLASLILGGLVPRGLVHAAQDAAVPRRREDRFKATPPAGRVAQREVEPRVDDPDAAGDDMPADFPSGTGGEWRKFGIEKYTRLTQNQDSSPQNAIVEWIFRRTGSSVWHGDKIAVLSAGRSQIRAYNDPKVLDQVEEMVERFTDAYADVLSIRVQIAAANDPRWRYAVYQRLNYHEGGPNGQQIWTAKVEDAALILSQMSVSQSMSLLADKEYKVINGQTLTIEALVKKDYIAGLQRASATGLGYQQAQKQLSEGIVLRMSPLLSFEGDQIELALDLRANTIKKLYSTKVVAPREVGPGEMSLDVPEVHESRLNQTIPDWPLDRTLIISAGILPGILQNKNSVLNRIPGWTPGNTELLLFLNAKVAAAAPPAKTARAKEREKPQARDRDDDLNINLDADPDRLGGERPRTRIGRRDVDQP